MNRLGFGLYFRPNMPCCHAWHWKHASPLQAATGMGVSVFQGPPPQMVVLPLVSFQAIKKGILKQRPMHIDLSCLQTIEGSHGMDAQWVGFVWDRSPTNPNQRAEVIEDCKLS